MIHHRLVWLVRSIMVITWMLLIGAANAAPVAISGSFAINAPASAPVGTPVTITVGPVAAPDGTAVQLVAIGSYGPRLYRAILAGGTATITLPATATREAGHVSLVATVDAARSSAALDLRATAPVTPIMPIVAPRTIVADGRDTGMAIAMPQDQFGNPVANGTSLLVRMLRADDRSTQRIVRVRNLLAWTRVRSGTRAGTTTVSVGKGAIVGAVLEEVAGRPVAFTISADSPALPADGRRSITLRTAPIRDRFGNMVPDGTLVTFIVDGPQREHSRTAAATIGGVAEALVQAPMLPGPAQVRAAIDQTVSAPLTLMFGVAVTPR